MLQERTVPTRDGILSYLRGRREPFLAGIAVGVVLGGVMPRFDRIVRCRRGHLYQTIWVPLGSFKAVRWFGRRLQWCPIGRHWSWVERVDEQTLSPEERRDAAAHHDIRIP